MSTARHHAEWLSLLEISGPFLSLPVLLEAFPQGLDADDPQRTAELRAAYEEWADNQGGLQPDPAIHNAWIRYVLRTVLELGELGEEVLLEGQAIPSSLKVTVAEHHETLRPDLILREPEGSVRLLVQTYPPEQDLEKALADRNWKASPATRMMELLHATEVRLGLVTNGEHWLLIQAKRGEATGYISWYAPLWTEERLTLRALRTFLGAYRFFGVPTEQTLEALLEASAKDQHEVTDQLGYQVRHAVEILVQAIDMADQDRGRSLLADVSETLLYETAVTVMMRLVFLFAAEERGLLLLGDPIYDQNYAVSTLRAQLRETADQYGEDLLERRYDAWSRLLATFRAVYGGVQHENMRLMAYGGSLFDPDRFPFLEGRLSGTHWQTSAADPLPIDNRTVLHLLEALQMLQVKTPGGGPSQARRLSFRALDIEQIGHVYEGLLDHTAVRAAAPVLGLQGTRDKEPEIALPRLEAYLGADGRLPETNLDGLLAFLKDESGRTPSALRNGLQSPIADPQAELKLRVACGNDEALLQRVLPWSGLLRADDYGHPVIIPAGSVYVTAGQSRRSSGAHYTPRILTEPIVQHTLEPLVYIGPAEGKPREEWVLRTPAEILALKLCDMAMGSGAFLVQACRYLSERLVEAWETVGALLDAPAITPEGKPASGDPAETIIPTDTEERLALARRLVADRCLYGVDKNPLAVEMAKLSLWLITLDKNRPFTFLDHALKHGDSLIGADEEMFLRWSESLKGTVGPLYFEENEKALALARQKRRALQDFTVNDVRDAQEKARLLSEAETAMTRVKLGCEMLIGVRLQDGLSASEKETWSAELLVEHTAKERPDSNKAQRALTAAQKFDAFHWPFEFPEVFSQGGFSAFVGNPPFVGGKRIRSNLGGGYRAALDELFPRSKGGADYSAFFFLKAFSALRPNGCLGLIATNTIAQGDTLDTGLEPIYKKSGVIYRAYNDYPWPGQAAVVVDIVHIISGPYSGVKYRCRTI